MTTRPTFAAVHSGRNFSHETGRLLVFGHMAESAARRPCAGLVQVAPGIEGPPALGSLLGLAALAPGALLRLGARHPRSATVLRPGVLGLDALVARGFYDTCCL